MASNYHPSIGVSDLQSEIDLMFWSYCVALLDLANAISGDDNYLLKMNSLADGRILAINRAYGRVPSYTVHYKYSGSMFRLQTKIIKR